MKQYVGKEREAAAHSKTPEGETKRVVAVHSDLAAKRNKELEKEVARLKERGRRVNRRSIEPSSHSHPMQGHS